MIKGLTKRTPDSPRAGSSRGFTLIEALATLVFIAIVLPVALQGITLALSLGSNAARQTEAILLAQSKMSELIATGAWQENSQLEGDFSDLTSQGSFSGTTVVDTTSRYRWSATVVDWLDSSLKELTVQVRWESRGLEREVILTTLVYMEEE